MAGLQPDRETAPEYIEYLAEKIRDAIRAGDIGIGEALDLVAREPNPTIVEAVASGVIASLDASTEAAVGLLIDGIPSVKDDGKRAALVRALGQTSEPSAVLVARLAKASYSELAKDPSPAVRTAVVRNLVQDDRRAFGRSPEITGAAIATATASDDARVQTSLFRAISLETAGAADVTAVSAFTGAVDAEVRAAAATALGTVSTDHAGPMVSRLAEVFGTEREGEVREAILASIVRLRLSDARPTLERLAREHPDAKPAIDAWIRAAGGSSPTWYRIERRRRLAADQVR